MDTKVVLRALVRATENVILFAYMQNRATSYNTDDYYQKKINKCRRQRNRFLGYLFQKLEEKKGNGLR